MASFHGAASSQSRSRGYAREAVVLASFLLLVLLFGVTSLVARIHRSEVQALGNQWFAKGEVSYQASHVTEAINDYRDALVYAPDNSRFQFHLAEALAAAGHEEEARSYLLNLLSESPGSGNVNLELARIAVHRGKMGEALRYYHGAIYGVWESDPIAMRWRVRRELCEYLLNQGAGNQAEGEIIGLTMNTPSNDVELMKVSGNLLLRAQLWNRALDQFRAVLAANRHDEEALAGAGTAAFQLNQYSQALEFLERLSKKKQVEPDIAEMLETCRQIQADDPSPRGLSLGERTRRAVKALALEESRIQECARAQSGASPDASTDSDLQEALAAIQKARLSWNDRSLSRHPDRVDQAMAMVFEIEDLAAQRCGAPQGEDRALWLLGRSREGANR